MNSSHSHTTKPLYRGIQVIWYILGGIQLLLLFRFALKLLGANAEAGLTSFIYEITHIFVAPFVGVFKISYVDGNVFEWTTLLAMLVYWIIAIGIIKLLLIGKTVSTQEAEKSLNEQSYL